MYTVERLLEGVIPAALDTRYVMPFDTGAMPSLETGMLVVGSGIAGLTAALHASRMCPVILVTKSEVRDTNTWYAQGGIAGAVGEADSVELHLADTLVVGQGLCDSGVVRAVVSEAAESLAELEELGVRFDRAEGGQIELAREGGHSLPRVLHSGDATGAEVQNTLSAVVRTTPGIDIRENVLLIDLLTADGRCCGAVVMERTSGELTMIRADAVVLATGGSGQAYRVTTNPLVATGDGVAAAWRAGADISDMEFVQFHPTALDSDASPKFLLTEALRGEGAYLLDDAGERFMLGAHPLAELAPRDVVSREMERVMHTSGRTHVWLDARHLGCDFLGRRFPTVTEGCREAGYDLCYDLIPVAPAAHYLVGGIRVDIDGRSSLPGLYASGECSASGLHGGNRLASNSLLEGLVFSRRIARAHARECGDPDPGRVVSGALSDSTGNARRVRAELQQVMSAHVAVVRSADTLAGAARVIDGLAGAPDARYPFAIETANLLVCASLITGAAALRRESRGTHYRSDYPARDDADWRVHSVWSRGAAPRLVPVPEEVAP